MKLWQLSTMTQNPFNSLAFIDFYKHETKRIGVC